MVNKYDFIEEERAYVEEKNHNNYPVDPGHGQLGL
jgi:hypothetical protein